MASLKSSRGLIISAFGETPQVKTFQLPKLTNQDVLVKVKCSPINPADIHLVGGHYGTTNQRLNQTFPMQCGMEGSGTVMETAHSSLGDLVGKRVSFLKSSPEVGPWGEHCVVDKNMLHVVPDTISDEVAACLHINPLTVAFMTFAAKKMGTNAIVQDAAASQLGKMLQKACNIVGIKTINIVRRDEQIETLRTLGAGDHFLNSEDPEFPRQLASLSKELKPRLALDAVGSTVLRHMVELMPEDSEIWIYGNLSNQPIRNVKGSYLLFENKTLKGFWLSTFMRLRENQELVEQSRQFVSQYVEDVFSTEIQAKYEYEKFQEALGRYKSNMSKGKILLTSASNI
mmetsp:Transcript_64774/g.74434  ORF Transcript_64774/g.74434 Transcript_64774/m.74434 type:complete len:343 (-) Transcript_64774:61-1089(-)